MRRSSRINKIGEEVLSKRVLGRRGCSGRGMRWMAGKGGAKHRTLTQTIAKRKELQTQSKIASDYTRLPLQPPFAECVQAADLNAFRPFPLATSNAEVLGQVARCQDRLHTWGEANGVEFGPNKEDSNVVSRSGPHGADFRILGVMFDTKLRMHAAVHDVAVERAWKLTALLRSRRYHDVLRLVLLCKAQLPSYIAYRTPAIYHAACSVLEPVDGVQQRFLRESCVSDEDAPFVFHLAPLSIRRDIAMLRVIHRTVLGRGPSQFRELFKLAPLDGHPARTRSQCSRHRFQLENPRGQHHSDMLARSALGPMWVYNHLPPKIV